MKMQNTGLKISLMFLGIVLLKFYATAQYYYSDILSSVDIQSNFSGLTKHKIKKVTVSAYDANNEKIEEFILYQDVKADKNQLTTYSKSNLSDASILETFYNDKHFPIQLIDSSEGASTRTYYGYDGLGRLIQLESNSIQQEQAENRVTEKRIYFYDNGSMPDSMHRIKGNRDTMRVLFLATENGLPGEEQWFKDGKKIETWFYYYDENNRLTDIVRYNMAAKKMLPDYLFGYDDQGNLSSKITVQPGTGAFRIWQYQYDVRGLKKEEQVKNRERQTEGKLVYTYQ
jgi:YD repeat-containing protein